jgi:hypothetical protein
MGELGSTFPRSVSSASAIPISSNDLPLFWLWARARSSAAGFAKHLALSWSCSYELLLNGWTHQPYEIRVSVPLQNARLLTPEPWRFGIVQQTWFNSQFLLEANPVMKHTFVLEILKSYGSIWMGAMRILRHPITAEQPNFCGSDCR